MDIQVSSNFERLLFEMNGRDGGMTAEQLTRFRSTGSSRRRSRIRREQFVSGHFRAAAFDDDATMTEIARIHRETGMLIDPHTATGTAAAALLTGLDGPDHPVVTMATAHPAKFPDAVERATGRRPQLPEHLADLFDLPERTQTVANDLAAVQALVEHLTHS